MNFNNQLFVASPSTYHPPPNASECTYPYPTLNGIQAHAPPQHVQPQVVLQQVQPPTPLQQQKFEGSSQALPPQRIPRTPRRRMIRQVIPTETSPRLVPTLEPSPPLQEVAPQTFCTQQVPQTCCLQEEPQVFCPQEVSQPMSMQQNAIDDQLLTEAEGLLTLYSLQSSPGCLDLREFLIQSGWNYVQVLERLGLMSASESQKFQAQDPRCYGRTHRIGVPAPQMSVSNPEISTDPTLCPAAATNDGSRQRKREADVVSLVAEERLFQCPKCPIVASDMETIDGHFARMHSINASSA